MKFDIAVGTTTFGYDLVAAGFRARDAEGCLAHQFQVDAAIEANLDFVVFKGQRVVARVSPRRRTTP